MSEENMAISAEELQRRREWFDLYLERINQALPPDPGSLPPYRCPCCQYPTLSERAAYEICPLCNWEDDGQDDPHENESWGGPNGRYSLAEARENFKRFWIMYAPGHDTRIAAPDSVLELQAKRAAARVYDALRMTTDEREREDLAGIIAVNMKTLHSELRRKIREHEAQRTSGAERP